MTSIAGVGPRRHAAPGGAFLRSMFAAAARGAGLVAAAIAVGVLLLRATEETGPRGGTGEVVAQTATTTTTTVAGVTPGVGLRPPGQVRVLVLNAARIEGAAGDLSDRLKQMGYSVLEPENAPTQAETIVYFKPGFEGEAAVLAPEASEDAITEPLPDPSPFAGTENADVVIVLGTELKETGGG